MTTTPYAVSDAVRHILHRAVGMGGDVTTAALIAPHVTALGSFVAHQPTTIAGLGVAAEIFRQVDPATVWTTHVLPGTVAEPGQVVATLTGPLASLVTASDLALNSMQYLSGIATQSNDIVESTTHTEAAILMDLPLATDAPALVLHAARLGGITPYRTSLSDAVLIGPHHIAAIGSASSAIKLVRANVSPSMKIAVEVSAISLLADALTASPDVVILYNMTPDQVREAVSINNFQSTLIATADDQRAVIAIAETGVGMVMVKNLTQMATPSNLTFTISRLAG